MIIIYKIKDEYRIKIYGENFINNNKNEIRTAKRNKKN